jgi:hypothetical protein
MTLDKLAREKGVRMDTTVSVAVAPNFHLPGAPADRVLIADGTAWRPASASEWTALAPASVPGAPGSGSVLLFVLPEHLRSAVWQLLERGGVRNEFDALAAEVGQFLAFKNLPPPERAIFELVLHGPAGNVATDDLWAVANLGDDPITIGVPGFRVRLQAGEGVRLPETVATEMIPPTEDVPDLLLTVRRALQSGQP